MGFSKLDIAGIILTIGVHRKNRIPFDSKKTEALLGLILLPKCQKYPSLSIVLAV